MTKPRESTPPSPELVSYALLIVVGGLWLYLAAAAMVALVKVLALALSVTVVATALGCRRGGP